MFHVIIDVADNSPFWSSSSLLPRLQSISNLVNPFSCIGFPISERPFLVLACHELVLDGFDQKFSSHSPLSS